MSKKSFNFRPYIFTPRSMSELQFYAEDGGILTMIRKMMFQ